MVELWHYTNLNALIGILQPDELCFWGTRFDSMNDPTEVKYAKDIVLPALIESLKGTDYESQIDEYTEVYPYIVSFSKSIDDLDMWRLYHAEVALVIDREVLEKEEKAREDAHQVGQPEGEKKDPLIQVQDVEYAKDKDDVAKKAVALFNKAMKSDNVIDTLLYSAFPFIKNVAYQTENEVRMVCSDFDGFLGYYNNGNPQIVDVEIPVDVKCRGVRNGQLLLYKEFKIPKEALLRIVVYTHDEAYFNQIKKPIQVWLVRNEYRADFPIERTNSYEFIG